MIFWPSSEDLNSPRGDPFQVWQLKLPLQEKWEMIRYAWGDGCRTSFGTQTSNESALTLSNEYIEWIMIFWPSSEDHNSPRVDPFQVWQLKLPLPEKWKMIRWACGNGCRTWSGPQMSNESASTLPNEYIGWIMIFWLSSEDLNLPRGDPYQFDKCGSPSKKNRKWSDALVATAAGRDQAPRSPMRVNQRC